VTARLVGRVAVALTKRRRPRRCRFQLQTGGGPMRCIFTAGHPAYGHNCSSDLTAPPVPAPAPLPHRPAR
jgi:hypothetical protein